MGANSSIEWTHHTFNPWWGCTKVSPGCENCYAEAFDRRVFGVDGRVNPETMERSRGGHWGPKAERRFFGAKHWAEPRKWHCAATVAGERQRVFCASMADVFEDRPDVESWRDLLWELILETPNLDWLLLTKRPDNMARMLPWPGLFAKPLANCWLGTTVEDKARRNRINALRAIPAAVRFLSLEPLIEDLGELDLTGIHWAIVGGESGRLARPMNEAWVRSIRDQCVEQGVRFFYKQKLAGGKKLSLPILDGRQWAEVPA